MDVYMATARERAEGRRQKAEGGGGLEGTDPQENLSGIGWFALVSVLHSRARKGRFVTLLLLGSRTDFTFEAASNNHCSQN